MPQHVVFAQVGVDEVTLVIQLLHHLQGQTHPGVIITQNYTSQSDTHLFETSAHNQILL